MADFEKVYKIKFDTRQAQSKLRDLERTMKKLDRRVESLGIDMRNFGKSGVDAMQKIKLASGGAVAGMNKVSRAAKMSGAQMAKFNQSARMAGSGDMLKGFSRNWNRYVTLPIGAGAVASLKFARDFNKGMANVATLIPGQTEKLNGLKGAVLDLSKETGKPLEDLTGGLYQVISAFGGNESVEEIMKRLEIATKAGVAGLASTDDALNLLSATTKGYGDTSAKAMQESSNLAFATVRLGQTTFPELAASMGRVIPLSAALDKRQYELFATMATLTGVTGNAAEVSTQLASVYSSVLKPSEAMTKMANKLGFETASAMVKSKGLAESIRLMGEYTKGDEKELAKLLTRKEALVAVLALAGGQADTYNEKLEEMRNLTDETTKAYREQTLGINKTGHSFEQTKAKLTALAVQLGDKLLPLFNKFLDRIDPLIQSLANMDDESMDLIITLGKWAVIFGAGSKLMVGLSGFQNMIVGMGGPGGSIGAMTGQVKGLSAAIPALQAALAGFAIGTAISETVLEPGAQKKSDFQRKIEESDIYAEQLIKSGADAATLEKARNAIIKGKVLLENAPLNQEEMAGTLIDPEGIGARQGRTSAGADAAVNRLNKAIAESKNRQALLEGGGMPVSQMQPVGAGAGTSINATNNITINAQGGDGKRIGKEVERALNRSMRKAQQGMGASQK